MGIFPCREGLSTGTNDPRHTLGEFTWGMGFYSLLLQALLQKFTSARNAG
ncbi:MAG: hypothetical protein HOD72_00570 [Opitutae bacterium]|nr:hypothetical protein [Opitutae bacterium]